MPKGPSVLLAKNVDDERKDKRVLQQNVVALGVVE
jgi:hypothetical protein